MKISVKSGLLNIFVGMYAFIMSFGLGFGDCFKSECNEQSYYALSILSLLILISGLVILLIGVYKLARRDSKNKIWLIAVIILYFLLALGSCYYLLGVDRYFEARTFRSNFKTTYFEISRLPDSYVERETSYSLSKNSDIFRPGNYAKTYFGKPVIDSNGDTYYEGFFLEQGDEMNDAAGILKFCGKTYDCDIINGNRVKNIHCQKVNRSLCSVQLEGTYISLNSRGKLSREDAVALIDSLVKK